MANRSRTVYLVVHVTATPPGWNKGAAGIRAMHKARGWSDIGYNEIINPDGSVERGRGINAIGAHVAGFNSIAYGVALVGGVDRNNNPDFSTITPNQLKALEKLLRLRSQTFPGAKICGHRDLSPDRDGDGFIEPHEHLKACPCFDAIPWARNHGLPAANIKGNWDRGHDPVLPSDAFPIPSLAPKGPDERAVYLQKLLRRAGYEFGAIDGIIGRNTQRAIKRFQSAAHLPLTGEFDEATVARLRAMFESNQKAKPMPTAIPERRQNPIARFFQALLRALGFAVIALAPLAALALTSTPTLAQGLPCMPFQELQTTLTEQYGEAAQNSGISAQDGAAIVVVFTAPGGDTWTIANIDLRTQTACVLAVGVSWNQKDIPPKPDPET